MTLLNDAPMAAPAHALSDEQEALVEMVRDFAPTHSVYVVNLPGFVGRPAVQGDPFDAAKGALAVNLAQHFWPEAVRFAAAGALVGHLYPVWLKFRGGKGVATLLGILIPLLPLAAAAYAAVWVGMLIALRISSVAGMAAAASAPLAAAIGGHDSLVPMLLLFAMLIVWKHRENVQRLKAGTEPRIGRRRA